MAIELIVGGIFFSILITILKKIYIKSNASIFENDLQEATNMKKGFKFFQFIGIYWAMLGLFIKILQIEFRDPLFEMLFFVGVGAAPILVQIYMNKRG